MINKYLKEIEEKLDYIKKLATDEKYLIKIADLITEDRNRLLKENEELKKKIKELENKEEVEII